MLIAVDLDGTIDAYPNIFQGVLSALKAAGNTVVVLTGSSSPTVTTADWQAKADFLTSIGCGACWDELVVIAHDPAAGDKDIHDAKAAWLKANHADVLIDNNKGNAKTAVAAAVPLVLVPWATKEK